MRVSWRLETRAKGVMFGMWRWARRIVIILMCREVYACELKGLSCSMLCDCGCCW